MYYGEWWLLPLDIQRNYRFSECPILTRNPNMRGLLDIVPFSASIRDVGDP